MSNNKNQKEGITEKPSLSCSITIPLQDSHNDLHTTGVDVGLPSWTTTNNYEDIGVPIPTRRTTTETKENDNETNQNFGLSVQQEQHNREDQKEQITSSGAEYVHSVEYKHDQNDIPLSGNTIYIASMTKGPSQSVLTNNNYETVKYEKDLELVDVASTTSTINSSSNNNENNNNKDDEHVFAAELVPEEIPLKVTQQQSSTWFHPKYIGIFVIIIITFSLIGIFVSLNNKAHNEQTSTSSTPIVPPSPTPFTKKTFQPTPTTNSSPPTLISSPFRPTTSSPVTPTTMMKTVIPSLQPTMIPTISNIDYIWNQLGQPLQGETAKDEFGYSVALASDGRTLAVGAYRNDNGGSNAGQVQMFMLSDDDVQWTQLGQPLQGEAAGDYFGDSIALSSHGRILAVGASYNNNGGSNAGQVQVFELNDSDAVVEWKQLGQPLQGEVAGDVFGRSVALSSDGHTLAVGAHNGLDDTGQVQVFKLSDDNNVEWKQLGQPLQGEAVDDWFGYPVALSSDGRTLAVGACGNDNGGSHSGQVQVFKLSDGDTEWKYLGQPLKGEAAGDYFGDSIALSSDGRILAVGASLNDNGGSNAGQVQVFKLSHDGVEWKQLGQPLQGESAGDVFGRSVDLSSDGHILAVGAIRNDNGGFDAGQVQVFELSVTNLNWKILGEPLQGKGSSDLFGFSVALSSDGHSLAVGALSNDNGGSNAGQVETFSLDIE